MEAEEEAEVEVEVEDRVDRVDRVPAGCLYPVEAVEAVLGLQAGRFDLD